MKQLVTLFLLTICCTSSLYAQKHHEEITCGSFTIEQDVNKTCTNPSHFHENLRGEGTHIGELSFSDRFGNTYCSSTLTELSSVITRTTPGGLFNLDFDPNIGNTFIDIVVQAFADFEVFIVEYDGECGREPIEIEIKLQEFGEDGPLAAASTFYYSFLVAESIQNGWVWEKINLGDIKHPLISPYDGFIQINPEFLQEFFIGYSQDLVNSAGAPIPDGIMDDGITNITEPLFDFYSLMTHEIMHLLGFTGRLTEFGTPYNTGNSYTYFTSLFEHNGEAYISQNPTNIFDWETLWNSASEFIAIGNSPCEENTILNDIPLYTFEDGVFDGRSSFSHIDDDCPTSLINHLMAPARAPREYSRITQDEVDILVALRYTLENEFGTTNLLAEPNTPNPNQEIFITNIDSPAPYLLDDPCNGTTDYLMEACVGTSFLFTEEIINEIVSNDENIENLDQVAMEIQFDQAGILLEQNASGLWEVEIGPDVIAGSQFKIRYLLFNEDSEFSDFNYITLEIYACSDHLESFYCDENTFDECNLICNSDLEANTEIMGIGWMNNLGSAHQAQIPSTDIPGWFGFGLQRVYSTVTSTQPEISRPTIVEPDDFIAIKQASNLGRYLTTNLKENIQPDQDYLLSFFTSAFDTGGEANVGLFRSIEDDTPYPFSFQVRESDFNPFPLLEDETVNAGDEYNWEQRILSFSVDESFEALYLSSDRGMMFYDYVELVPDNMFNIPREVRCEAGMAQLGLALCEVTGMVYSWWEITDGENTQLTQGSDDLIDDDGISPIGNGSQLQLEGVNGDRLFELRRNFLPTQTQEGPTTLFSSYNDPQTVNASISIAYSCCPGCDEAFDTILDNFIPTPLCGIYSLFIPDGALDCFQLSYTINNGEEVFLEEGPNSIFLGQPGLQEITFVLYEGGVGCKKESYRIDEDCGVSCDDFLDSVMNSIEESNTCGTYTAIVPEGFIDEYYVTYSVNNGIEVIMAEGLNEITLPGDGSYEIVIRVYNRNGACAKDSVKVRVDCCPDCNEVMDSLIGSFSEIPDKCGGFAAVIPEEALDCYTVAYQIEGYEIEYVDEVNLEISFYDPGSITFFLFQDNVLCAKEALEVMFCCDCDREYSTDLVYEVFTNMEVICETLSLNTSTVPSDSCHQLIIDWGDGSIEEINSHSNISHQYEEPGTYNVIAAAELNGETCFKALKVWDLSCRTNKKDVETKVTVNPNPSSDWISIQSEFSEISCIRLIDNFGNTLQATSMNLFSTKQELDISQHPSGFYIVEVILTSGEVVYRRIIKQ